MVEAIQGRLCLEPFRLIGGHRVSCWDLQRATWIARSEPECDLGIGLSYDNVGLDCGLDLIAGLDLSIFCLVSKPQGQDILFLWMGLVEQNRAI